MTYIDPRGKVFAHLDRIAGWRAGEKPAPVTIEWDLSSRCPLGCWGCHFAYTHSRGPWTSQPRMLPMAYDGVGDLADRTIVMDALIDARQMGVRSIVWSGGGEPTTHPNWEEIIGHAHQLGLDQGMYTMGGLLTTASAKTLAYAASWVVVSLDAADATTYAKEKGVPPSRFAAACRGAELLSTYGLATVGVSFLLHAENWTRATDMLELARSLGATYTTFRPTVETSPDRPSICTADRSWVTHAEVLLEALAGEDDVEIDTDRFRTYRDWDGHGYTTCHGIKLSTTITPDGRVWICGNRRGMASSAYGDLRTESLRDIWARHPGTWTDFANCRVMCKLHPVNEMLEAIETPRQHEAFI